MKRIDPRLDPVAQWKRIARARLESEGSVGAKAARPSLRLTPGFYAVCAVSGLSLGRFGLLVSVFGVAAAVLLQELLHATLARAMGRRDDVLISALGPEAQSDAQALAGPRSLALEYAGPFGNLAAAVAMMALSHRPFASHAALFLQAIAVSHAVWGAAQVVPILPFRAGRRLAERMQLPHHFGFAVTSGLLAFGALVCIDLGRHYVLVPVVTFVALVAAAHAGRLLPEYWDFRSGIFARAAHAASLLQQGRLNEAIGFAEEGLRLLRSQRANRMLSSTLFWAAIAENDPLLAHRALCRLPAVAIDSHLVAAYLSCCNRLEEAESLLREARAHGQVDRESTTLLIDVLFRRGNSRAALDLAVTSDASLAQSDWDAIEAAIANARRPRRAAH